MTPTPDEIRRTTLDAIEKHDRAYKAAFIAGACVEVLFLILFFSLMNTHERLHILILIATVSSYTIIILGLVAVGALMNRNAQRILRAIADNQHG